MMIRLNGCLKRPKNKIQFIKGMLYAYIWKSLLKSFNTVAILNRIKDALKDACLLSCYCAGYGYSGGPL